ncbi:MAG: hypothetical protein DHS20C02_02180 [Micavibrio sp.]|nr:MAG: hypothetical protein DHS20C02_02180 [Micavibrio sp.]
MGNGFLTKMWAAFGYASLFALMAFMMNPAAFGAFTAAYGVGGVTPDALYKTTAKAVEYSISYVFNSIAASGPLLTQVFGAASWGGSALLEGAEYVVESISAPENALSLG